MSIGVERVAPAAGMPASVDQSAAAGHDDGGFSALLPQAAGALPAPQQAGAAPPLTGVAWLQAGIADALARDARDKEARRHGRAMLQALGAVQLAMLAGDGDEAKTALARLASTAGEPHPAEDPVLRLIMREIAVRAAVELARSEDAGPDGAPNDATSGEDVSTV